MADRTFNVKFGGFTPSGYALNIETSDVPGEKLKDLVGWIDQRFSSLQIQPAIFSKSTPPPDNKNGPETQQCPIHNCEMERHEKGNSHWYSHKVVDKDGTETWCRGK